ncbi:helix-turn-helix transcriptional regulator [Roseateles flavus]|uniref:AlpA family phage regulatory protein n=1 Tax=Roseateles flavus TaxID=3149041 RepID=A0ABV0GKS6_9BURK
MSSIFLPPPQRSLASSQHLPAPSRSVPVRRKAPAKPVVSRQLTPVNLCNAEHPVTAQAAALLDPVLRLPKVLELTGCAQSTWLRYVKQGLAPKGIRLGPNTVGWFQSSIVAWLQSRPQA